MRTWEELFVNERKVAPNAKALLPILVFLVLYLGLGLILE